MNYITLILLSFISVFFLGCGPERIDSPNRGGSLPQGRPLASVAPPPFVPPPFVPPPVPPLGQAVDSTHVKVELVNNAWVYHIKQAVIQDVVFIKNNGTETAGVLEELSIHDMNTLAYVLIPDNHWFVKSNPFSALGADINLKRHVLWDKELINEKTDQACVLLRVAQNIALPVVKIQDPALLFPNYLASKIGQGGIGIVYKITYQGSDYALKENASEFAEMERLFFSGGVLETFAYFKHSNKMYMIMPLAIKSLEKNITDGDPFDLKEEGIKKLLNTIKVSKLLNIDNNDIKPDNIMITLEGPKLIDISDATTRGYSSSSGVKLLHALLEGLSRKSFKGGYVNLERYYEFNEVYRTNNVASNGYLKYFFKYVCTKENLSNNCDTIDTYNDLFKLLKTNKLNDLALKTNQNYHDNTGTKDQNNAHGGLYATQLDYPWLKAEPDRDYPAYFAKREDIIVGFCEGIEDATLIGSTYKLAFFAELKPAYSARCLPDAMNTNKPLLLKEFLAAGDQNFKDFVMDAFKPVIQFNSFIELAKKYSSRKKVFKFIILKESALLALPNNVKNALEELLLY